MSDDHWFKLWNATATRDGDAENRTRNIAAAWDFMGSNSNLEAIPWRHSRQSVRENSQSSALNAG